MRSNKNFGRVKFLTCLQMAVIAMLWVSCEREYLDEGVDYSYRSKPMVAASFRANMKTESSSLRSGVVYGNVDFASGEKFIWHENDNIGVFGVDANSSLIYDAATPIKGYNFKIADYSNVEASYDADFDGFMPSDLVDMKMKRMLAVSGLEYSDISSDKRTPYFYIKHSNPLQIGTSTSHLSEMDFMYSVSDTMIEHPLRSNTDQHILPDLSMKHISSLLRYRVINETETEWRVVKIEVSAIDTATGNPADVFYADRYVKIDIPNAKLVCTEYWADYSSNCILNLVESEQDRKGMVIAAGSTVDGYQMIIPSRDLSTVDLNFSIVLTSLDGKTIHTCNPLVVPGEKILHKRFESGYRYAFGLKISNTLFEKKPGVTLKFPGSGTEEDPFVVSDSKSLSDIRDLINMGSDEYLNAHYRLTGDIQMVDSVNWEPMAPNEDKPFNGVFDGAGSSISHLSFTNEESSMRNGVGLFGYLGDKAVVRDLFINNVSFNGMISESGAIAGQNKGTIIGCCVNSGNIGDKNVGSYIGGLVGKNKGSIQKSCCLADVYGGAYSGCLVGYNGGSVVACYTTGNFIGSESIYHSGLVGHSVAGSCIVGCYSRGGSIECGYSGGGLAGYVEKDAYLIGSYATGKVSIRSATGKNVGSLVGRLFGEMAYCATPNNVGSKDGVGVIGSTGNVIRDTSSSGIYKIVTSVPESYNGGVVTNGTVIVDGEEYSLGQAPGKSLWKSSVTPSLYWEK